MTEEIDRQRPNPFEDYANTMRTRTFIGTLLKFNKGDFVAGELNEDVPTGTRFVAIMDQLLIGWQRWDDDRPTEQRMGLLADGFVPPKRGELSDPDEKSWPLDDDGEPRDPWQYSNYLVLVGPDDEHDVYTFTSASKGGLGAIGELCKVYGGHIRAKPDEYPIVKLGVGSYQHKDRSLGRIKFPVFDVVGWVPKDDYLAAVAKASGSTGANEDNNHDAGAGTETSPLF